MAEGLAKVVLDGAIKAAGRGINKRLWKVANQYIIEHQSDDVSALLSIRIKLLSPRTEK